MPSLSASAGQPSLWIGLHPPFLRAVEPATCSVIWVGAVMHCHGRAIQTVLKEARFCLAPPGKEKTVLVLFF